MSSERPLKPGQERYLHGHHDSAVRIHARRTVENSAAYLKPHLAAGKSLLDVGSGPGTITIDFAQRLAPGKVIGLDPSVEVVASATELALQKGIQNVEFAAGNIYELPFPDNSFDIVHAHQVLQYMSEPELALAEMGRVTKPGGIVAARDVDYGGCRWFPWIEPIEEWRDLYQEVARYGGGEPDAGPQLKTWALNSGAFSKVETSASIWCFSTDEEREWWGGAWADRVLFSSFRDNALESGYADEAMLDRISVAWREWAAAENGIFNLPHNEILCFK